MSHWKFGCQLKKTSSLAGFLLLMVVLSLFSNSAWLIPRIIGHYDNPKTSSFLLNTPIHRRDGLLTVGVISPQNHTTNMLSTLSSTSTDLVKKDIPRFFLHIGPHKTATTSIQCALSHYQEILKTKDSILFLGKVDERYCPSFPLGKEIHHNAQDQRIRNIHNCLSEPQCWLNLTNEWEENRKNGYDMVLSKEGLSDLTSLTNNLTQDQEQFWPAMQRALVGWNVTVVLTYRRFFEWLPSAFNQHAFHMRLQARKEPWPQSPNEKVMTLEQIVEGIVGGTISSPYPFVDSILQTMNITAKWNYHVMNMHRTPDVVHSFLCQEILNASHTCSIYQPLLRSRQSPADDLVYDYLNVQALQWGWMREDHRRGKRARSTRSFVENVLKVSPLVFPQNCPSLSLMESFLAYSIAMEDKVVGNVDVQDHTDRFWRFSKNLCTVNATKVLLANATAWKKFYASL